MARRFAVVCLLLLPAAVNAQPPREPAGRLEFNRMIAHLAGYSDPGYLKFIEDAKPQVVQVGWYGAHFYSLAWTPHGKGYPANFPVQGLRECGDWFENLNKDLHKHDVKVVGHFNVEFLVGDADSKEGPRGFFKFYRDLWDEKELGPRPVKDPIELLERNAEGKPIIDNNYSIGGMKEYWGCLNNPLWRQVLKAWAKVAVKRGVDGLIANYFYRHNCMCPHCVKGFKDHLRGHYSPVQLRDKFAIADLDQYQFTEIVGWHDPKQSTPLRREMLRFSQIGTKAAFDDVLVKYGRSLKPGLIVGQWNHLGDFSQINGDERCMLPAELWGKDEDYLWYSTGAAAYFTDLNKRFLGEGTLQARFIRGAFDNRPFTLGKYESTRIRLAMSEMVANGGAAMGLYANYTDPLARKELVRYFTFFRENSAVYHANRPHAEVVLLFPRSRVHQGDIDAVDSFRKLGRKLLDDHILFDVVPDDIATTDRLKPYAHVIKATDSDDTLPQKRLSRFEAPYTVRVSASRPAKGNEVTLHFVNYNRKESKEKQAGIGDENPLAVEGVKVNFVLPSGAKVTRVQVLTPEESEPVVLATQQQDGRLQFTLPRFLVYAIARIHLE